MLTNSTVFNRRLIVFSGDFNYELDCKLFPLFFFISSNTYTKWQCIQIPLQTDVLLQDFTSGNKAILFLPDSTALLMAIRLKTKPNQTEQNSTLKKPRHQINIVQDESLVSIIQCSFIWLHTAFLVEMNRNT